MLTNTWHAAAALTEIGGIVEDQVNIDFDQTLQADPMMTAICNNMPNRPITKEVLYRIEYRIERQIISNLYKSYVVHVLPTRKGK